MGDMCDWFFDVPLLMRVVSSDMCELLLGLFRVFAGFPGDVLLMWLQELSTLR